MQSIPSESLQSKGKTENKQIITRIIKYKGEVQGAGRTATNHGYIENKEATLCIPIHRIRGLFNHGWSWTSRQSGESSHSQTAAWKWVILKKLPRSSKSAACPFGHLQQSLKDNSFSSPTFKILSERFALSVSNRKSYGEEDSWKCTSQFFLYDAEENLEEAAMTSTGQ